MFIHSHVGAGKIIYDHIIVDESIDYNDMSLVWLLPKNSNQCDITLCKFVQVYIYQCHKDIS